MKDTLCWTRDPGAPLARRVVVVVAHPDDETIGAGALLARLRDPVVVHVTDGAPRDRRWWGRPDLPSREAYAGLRRAELAAALAEAGIAEEQCRSLGWTDQETAHDLLRLADELGELLRRLEPTLVLTHPYEGGHPDHDSVAFAVAAAHREMAREGAAPPVAEFTSYHARDGVLRTGEFLPFPGAEEVRVDLSPEERERKGRMLARFASQAETLRPFGTEHERFRTAPAYDFTRPPAPGPLHYEQFDWGVTGEAWRARAREALAAPAQEGVPCP